MSPFLSGAIEDGRYECIRGGARTGLNMVVLMSLNKSSNSVAITRSVCYNVKASAGAETPNGAMVAKESTIGVKEACEACRGWGHTSSPETEAGFCKPPPFTAREEHSADGL